MSAVQVMYLPRCAIKIFAHAHSSCLSGFHINRTQRTQAKCLLANRIFIKGTLVRSTQTSDSEIMFNEQSEWSVV